MDYLDEKEVPGTVGGVFIRQNEEDAVCLFFILAVGFIPMGYMFIEIDAVWALVLYIAAGIMSVFVMGSGFRCRWSADENGFTLKSGFFTRRVAMKDIQHVDITYQHTPRKVKYHTRVMLIVMDKSGNKKTYTEISTVDYQELMQSPDTCEKPQLLVLYRYLQQVKEVKI